MRYLKLLLSFILFYSFSIFSSAQYEVLDVNELSELFNLESEQMDSITKINEIYMQSLASIKEDNLLSENQQDSASTELLQLKYELVSEILDDEQYSIYLELEEERKVNERRSHLERDLNLTDAQKVEYTEINVDYKEGLKEVESNITLTETEKQSLMRDLGSEKYTGLKKLMTPEQFKVYNNYQRSPE